MAIPYLNGYLVKPSFISESGIAYFTDGTNDILPNQQQCEAYGYTYDKETGTCRAFTYSANLERNFVNENNFVKGSGHTIETGTNTTQIMGENNTVKGLSRNNLIIGSNNQIDNGVNNATVIGTYGRAERDGEFVIGGGGFSGSGVGKSQASTITLTGTTTDATGTNLLVNGEVGKTIIDREAVTNSFQGFEANVMGVRTGGTAGGSPYDRILLRATGLVYLKIVDQSVATLGSFGTVTGWTAEMAFSGTNDMLFQVTGAANMNISWSCTLNIYNIKV